MKTKFKRLKTRSLIDSRPVVVTLTLIQTGTIQTPRFTSRAHLWEAGGNQSPRGKPTQTRAERADSTWTVAAARNRFFPIGMIME